MNALVALLRRLWDAAPTTTDRIISTDARRQACLHAAICARIVILYLMMSGSYIGGYANLTSEITDNGEVGKRITEFRFLWPRLILMQLTSAVALGWLAHRLSNRPLERSRWRAALRALGILTVGFVIGALAKQLGARNALVPCGHVLEFLQRNDQTYSSGGGPLGSPDFETIATGVFTAVSLLLTVRFLQTDGFPTRSEAFFKSLAIALYTCACYALVFTLYHVLIGAGWLVKEDHFLSPCIFKYQFPHPERIALVFVCVFLNTAILSILLWGYSRPSRDQRIGTA
jgi:hypothetical protein